MNYSPSQLNNDIDYQEIQPPNWLKDKIIYYWEINTHEEIVNYPIIPDGCVDLVINCTNNFQTFVSPTLIKPEIYTLAQKETWFGVCFFPGVITNILNIDLSKLQFQVIALEDIKMDLSRQILFALKASTSFEERVNSLNVLFSEIGLAVPSNERNLINQVIEAIYQTNGRILLKSYNEHNFSISKRHLRRLFNQEIGVSPKRFARIVRSQFFLHRLKQNPKTKSYYDLYFDQAHMIREIKEMTGLTPKELILKFN